MTHAWPVKVGEKLKRVELHAKVGGARQWGITSCLNGDAVLVFANPGKSAKFGYDKWERELANGDYHYTGQGPVGDQVVDSRANKSLLKTQASNAPIHLFEVDGTTVTYKGPYKLDSNPYRYERSLDLNGNDRRVIVFHLIQA
jgi:hypothetical protein